MSRYLLLLILNLPLILMAIMAIITRYKLRKASRRRTVAHLLFWLLILTGLIFAQPLYEWLFSSGYTDTDSLSLFDVIQITAIVAILYVVTRMRSRVDTLEQKLASLHREMSILMSNKRQD